MKKKVFSDLFAKTDYAIMCGISAYLTMLLVDLLSATSQDLFLTIAPLSVLKMGIFFIVGGALICLHDKLTKSDIRSITIILSCVTLLVAIYKSMSFFLSLGLILLALILFIGGMLNKEKSSYLYVLVILLAIPRLLTLGSSNFQDQALGFHAVDLSSTRFLSIIWPVAIASIISVAFIILYFKFPIYNYLERHKKIVRTIVFSLVLVYVLYLSVVVVYKVKTNELSSFDIGIFSQMFERMNHDLTPITTLERDRVLSHFAVHISPIFYLMLPFYKLFPYVETLEILQLIVVFSGIIPLRLILRKLKFSALTNTLTLLWFVLLPVMTTAGGFHLHENCFLVPLVFWVFYFIISEQKWKILLATILLLLVKEDAFIYVLSMGLYFLFQKRFDLSKQTKRWLLFTEIVLPIAYFIFAMYLLSAYGEGGMVSRFDAFLLNGESGMLMVIKNLFFHPGYVISTLLTAKRLGYLFLMFAPVCFLGLLQRRWSTYFLLIPLIVINLLPNWPYQYDIGFQYSYGSGALVFIMTLLALEDLKETNILQEKMAVAIVIVGIIFSGSLLHHFTPNWSFNIGYYRQNKEMFDEIQKTLGSLPKDASVLAEGAYTPALRGHKKLFDIFYHNDKKADPTIDYIVIPQSQKDQNEEYNQLLESYEALGYRESQYSSAHVYILEKAK